MKTIALIGVTLTMAIAGCQTADPMAKQNALAADGWQRLDAQTLRAATIGMTHSGTVKDGRVWAVYYEPDGTMRGSVGTDADTGTYTIAEDGTYCRKWNKFVKGREGCAQHYQRGNEIMGVKVSGEYNIDKPWTSEPGNTRNL